MAYNVYKYFILVAVAFGVLCPPISAAEFHCEAALSYKWRKDKEEVANEEFFSSVEEKGADEVSAKDALTRKIAREKSRAKEECKREHENLSGCIAAKYAAIASVLSSLGFSARKAVQDAIASDCTSIQGVCSQVVSSEPVCKELAVAGGEKSGEEGAKEGEKGKKPGKEEKGKKK